jgi:hypothetical protein
MREIPSLPQHFLTHVNESEKEKFFHLFCKPDTNPQPSVEMSTAVADNATALTLEEKKALLAKREAALLARQVQSKRESNARLDMARKMSAARSKPGCVTLPCIFIGRRQPRSSAGDVAAAGQGGGGKDKKDPPVVIDVIASVRGLAAHKAPGLEYEVVSPMAIKIPARDPARQKKAREALKAAVTKEEKALCQLEVDASTAIVGWMTIVDGMAYSVKTFSQKSANDLLPLYTVQLAALEAVYQKFPRKSDGFMIERIELQCGVPVPLECRYSPKVMLADMMDLHQLAVQLPDANNTYPGAMLAYFKEYHRTIEDEDNGRGCVVNKWLNNNIRPDDYIFVPNDTKLESLIAMTYRMGQDQDGSDPAFPVQGTFGIQARFYEGGRDDQKIKTLVRTAFGINKPKEWSEIMATNSPSAIVAGSISTKDTLAMNPGADHKLHSGTVCFYGNAIYVELREYLLERCPQVSLAWVMRKFHVKGNPNDVEVNFRLDNPQYACLLNRANLAYNEVDRSYTLRAERVINVGEFNGDIKDIIARSPTPCEFRVMHSHYLDDLQRTRLAQLDTASAEKCLSSADDALIRLDQPLTTVVYLVATMSEDEKEANLKAEGKWLERRKANLAAAAAAALPPTVNADGNPMGDNDADEDAPYEDDDSEPEENPEVLKARLQFPDEQDPDANVPGATGVEEDLIKEALRRQIQDELDEAESNQGTKRTAPQEVVALESEQQPPQASDEIPEPVAAAVPARGRKQAPPSSSGTSKRRVGKASKAEPGDYEMELE